MNYLFEISYSVGRGKSPSSRRTKVVDHTLTFLHCGAAKIGAVLKGLALIVNYNQVREIGALLNRLPQYHPKENVVVVDDGSDDGSRELAQNLGYQVVAHGENRGVGAAIRTGLLHAKENNFDYVIIMAANGKMRPEDLPQVTRPIVDGKADYVVGSRFMRGGSSPGLTPFRRLAIPIFSIMTSLILFRWFTDITCGYRAYRLDFLKNPKMNIHQSWLDRYELEYYLQYWAVKLGLRITEVPITFTYQHLERGRKSKITPLVGWWSMVRPFMLLTLRIRR